MVGKMAERMVVTTVVWKGWEKVELLAELVVMMVVAKDEPKDK